MFFPHLTDRSRRTAFDPLAPSLWVLIAVFLAGCMFFAWGAPRGFDIADEAYYVISSAQPFDFPSLTEAGALWHPFYLLAGGNIVTFRVLGLLVMQTCGLVFSLALLRFAGPTLPEARGRLAVILVIAVAVFWEYDSWIPTPSYNRLNLCGLMLFFAGLMFASAKREDRSAVALPAMLAGLGLCIMVWCKPTSAAMAVPAGLAWMLVTRQRQPVLAMTVAAVTALALFALSVLLIDGSIAAFLARKTVSLQGLRTVGGNHDPAGIIRSVAGPFLPHSFPKLAGALMAGMAFFLPAVLWVAILRSGTARPYRLGAIVCALLLAIATAVFRSLDFAPAVSTTAFHGWHVALLICAATVFLALWDNRSWPVLLPAVILAIAPLIYSLGTGSTILRHMSSASVFWAAAAVLMVTSAPAARRTALLAMTALLCGLVTLGMMGGVAYAIAFHGEPLWRQTAPVIIGNTSLRIDPRAADYLHRLQDTAHSNGFADGDGVLDISGYGPGITMALNGKMLGAFWLHYSSSGDPMSYIQYAIAGVPRGQLCRAWIVTGRSLAAELERKTLMQSGLDFPAGYEKLLALSHPEMEWEQTLWKPRNGNGCRA